MPCEFYKSQDGNMTIMQLRSGLSKTHAFMLELVDFVKNSGFKEITILTSSMSPVKRERESNRQLPEIFAYCNNFLYKESNKQYYNEIGMRKFGYWIADSKTKPHQELTELAGGGTKMMKIFNREDIPVSMFIIFCTGGVDFVGGYSYFTFMKNNLSSTEASVRSKLGDLKLDS